MKKRTQNSGKQKNNNKTITKKQSNQSIYKVLNEYYTIYRIHKKSTVLIRFKVPNLRTIICFLLQLLQNSVFSISEKKSNQKIPKNYKIILLKRKTEIFKDLI